MSRALAEMAADERLAVIIPAFKGRHLAATLASFAAQTDRRFRVYVADDGSPEELAPIVAPFRAQLDLVYHRFPENLGRTSLAGHWHRAMALSRERWVWLFSDDDLVSPDSVAAFWAERARRPSSAGLLRFVCSWVGPEGGEGPGLPIAPYPEEQTWHEHLAAIARPDGVHLILIQNIIFPRELWAREGGFADYPFGLWSDVITWARFARHDPIRTLPAGRVFYRVHPGSIAGGTLFGANDRCELIRTAGRLMADLRALYRAEGRPMPTWGCLQWFARMFRPSPYPLSAAERRAATEALAQGWPHWPLWRSAVFWWHASRPHLRAHPWLHRLARRRLAAAEHRASASGGKTTAFAK